MTAGGGLRLVQRGMVFAEKENKCLCCVDKELGVRGNLGVTRVFNRFSLGVLVLLANRVDCIAFVFFFLSSAMKRSTDSWE